MDICLFIDNTNDIELVKYFAGRLSEINNSNVTIVLRNRVQKPIPFLFKLYCKIDKCIFNNINISHKSINANYFRNTTHTLDVHDVSHAKNITFDVIIDLALTPINNNELNVPRIGTFRFNRITTLGIPIYALGFEEMLKSYDRATITLYLKLIDNREVLISTECINTVKYSLWLNILGVLQVQANMIVQVLNSIDSSGARFNKSIQNDYAFLAKNYTPASEITSNTAVIKFLSKTVALSLLRLFFRKSTKWHVLYCFTENNNSTMHNHDNYQTINVHGGYCADPFPILYNNEHWLFLEEYDDSKELGHISAVKVSANCNYPEIKAVIKSEHHMSFPFIFEYNNSLFMIPECSSCNNIILYRCMIFPDKWEVERTLIEDIKAVDTTIEFINGKWWLFTSKQSTLTDSFDANLCIYYSESLDGVFKPHIKNPVKIDPASSRNAGRIIHQNNRLYRPSQNCRRTYGEKIIINEITTLTVDNYNEIYSARVENIHQSKGMHTINYSDGLKTIDICDDFYSSRGIDLINKLLHAVD